MCNIICSLRISRGDATQQEKTSDDTIEDTYYTVAVDDADGEKVRLLPIAEIRHLRISCGKFQLLSVVEPNA